MVRRSKRIARKPVDVYAQAYKMLIEGNIGFALMTAIKMSAPKLAGADLIMLAGFVNNLPIG